MNKCDKCGGEVCPCCGKAKEPTSGKEIVYVPVFYPNYVPPQPTWIYPHWQPIQTVPTCWPVEPGTNGIKIIYTTNASDKP
jgi:hypothetical protein